MISRYQIRISGELVETPIDWEFTIFNSLFSFQKVIGISAYEIKVSGSDQTLRLFGHINDPRRFYVPQILDATIEMGGILVDTGKVIIRQSGNDFLLSYTSNISKVFGELSGRNIQEFNIGSGDFSVSPAAALLNDWEDGYTLPQVANSKFYGGNDPLGFNGIINERNGTGLTGTAYCPMVFLKYILNEWADYAGISFQGNFWVSNELQRALFYSNINHDAVFYFQKLLPSLTIEGLVMQLRLIFNLWVRVDVLRGVISMDFARDIITEVPEEDWTLKFKKIDNGEPVVTSGIAFSVKKDNNDDLMKEAAFEEFLSINDGGEYSRLEISTELSGLSDFSGVPTVSQEGYHGETQGKDAGSRILFYDTATKTSYSTVGGVSITPSNLISEYWSEYNEFLKNSYRYKGLVDLNGGEIARLSSIFRGAVAGVPIVHAQGLNWLIESVTVPTSGLPEIVMWRI